MPAVTVTITVQGKTVPADQVRDAQISAALKQMGTQVGSKLRGVRCPEHQKEATNVRIHVGRNGTTDLKYDSCCPKLADQVNRALGE